METEVISSQILYLGCQDVWVLLIWALRGVHILMTGVIFSIKKTCAVVAVCCHTAVLFLSVKSLELVSIPGSILGESDTALWKLKCLWKELLIFDQLGSPCY